MNFRNKKRLQIINYIFKKKNVQELNKEFIIKLVYLSDKLFLLKYGSTLTSDKFIAFQRGPACSQTLGILDADKERVEDKERQVIETFKNVYDVNYRPKTKKIHTIFGENLPDNFSALSENEKEVLDIVINRFGNMSYEDLSKYTHTFNEWKQQEAKLGGNDSSCAEIDIKDVFEDKVFLEDEELSKYLNEEMIQISAAIYNGAF